MSPHPQQHRENPEPREARNPVPVSVIGLVCLMLGWAVGYLMAAQPEADPRLGDQRVALLAGAEVIARKAPAAADAEAADGSAGAVAAVENAAPPVDGAALYATHCVACHQATGAGLPGVFPPLVGSEWVLGDEDTLVQILLHGVAGQIEVAGQNYQGAMPAFGPRLSDAEIAALASHVRTTWGNSAGAVDVAAVAAARARTADRSTPWGGGAELASQAP